MGEYYDFTSYNNIAKLPEDELISLWNEYLIKRDKETRDKLIIQYIYLVKYVVNRVKVTLPPTISLEDITGYGIEGLINSIERFSAQKNSRFETYALIRIRGQIIDKIRSEDFLPRSLRQKIKNIKDAQEYLKQELGRMPTTQELSKYVDIPAEKINQLLSEEVTITSIYEKKGTSDDSIEIIDSIEDTNQTDPLNKIESKDIKQELETALQRLPERERIIMVLYYQENMTLKEIGATLDMSESRTCQLHAQGIMKLKNILSETRNKRLQQAIIAD